MRMRPRGDFPAALRLTRSQKEIQARSPTSLEPQKNQTANKLFFERPMRSSRPRPQTQVVFLPPDPVWVSRALTPTRPGSSYPSTLLPTAQPLLPHRRDETTRIP